MKNDIKQIDIDLVYLWVDGNDPEWQAKRIAFIGNADENSPINCKGRWSDNDELKYSLRSVEKYAPWIRKIFIVTDSQTPDWLDTTNQKIKMVDHKDIMPDISLPCFNSNLLECFLHKIPDLSEYFLFANDDTFINKPVSHNTFFADDGFPIIRLTSKPFRKLLWYLKENICKKPLPHYKRAIVNATELVEKKYGIYYNSLPHHNIDAYLRSNCQRVVEHIFKNEFETVFKNRKRNLNDIQRIVYSFVALAEKQGHLHYVSRKKSFIFQIHKKKYYSKFATYDPMLFCINDNNFADDNDRKNLNEFLNNRFPEKSNFEK